MNEIYNNFETKFNVIHPKRQNATYFSPLNYTDDLLKPFQRWFRYKEGFSVNLMKQLIIEYMKNNEGTILDPFLGSGTTLLAANQLGFKGIGFEINPFSYFLSKCKLNNYSLELINEFKDSYSDLIKNEEYYDYKMPQLSFSNKVFDIETERYYMSIKHKIDNVFNKEVHDLLLLGWLACLEPLSNYRKTGNGLKKRINKTVTSSKSIAYNSLFIQYSQMYEDLNKKEFKNNVELYNISCLEMMNKLSLNSISGILFSPPYANCFDYTEIYKLELWFGDFVNEYRDLKPLRINSIRSHLNSNLDKTEIKTIETLEYLLHNLDLNKLWSKKIPQMLRNYYQDLFSVLEQCYYLLEDGGFCSIIVANSAYGGVIFPADLLFAEYAQSIGFKVDKIIVGRYIIPSSQQYKTTFANKKYLRESIVCLLK
jgi:DNA modification methylase